MSQTPFEHMLPVPLGNRRDPWPIKQLEMEVLRTLHEIGIFKAGDGLKAKQLYLSQEKVFLELDFLPPLNLGGPSQNIPHKPSTDPAGEPSAPSKPVEPVNPSKTAGRPRAPRRSAFPISKS